MPAPIPQRFHPFLLLQHLLPQHWITALAGHLARSRMRWLARLLIGLFRRLFPVNLEEAACSDPRGYGSFQEFFTRALAEGAREVCEEPRVIVSPCDGTLAEAGPLDGTRLIQAKGISYSAEELLGDPALAERFRDGSFVTVYLAPADYHRVHMPVDGVLERMTYVPGRLFSVNLLTARLRDGLFSRNERVVCTFRGPEGPFAMVLVGAMIVGGIRTVWSGRVTPRSGEPWTLTSEARVSLGRGAEMGCFEIGSTVIMLFPGGRAGWTPELQPGTRLRMGQRIGRLLEARQAEPFDPGATADATPISSDPS